MTNRMLEEEARDYVNQWHVKTSRTNMDAICSTDYGDINISVLIEDAERNQDYITAYALAILWDEVTNPPVEPWWRRLLKRYKIYT